MLRARADRINRLVRRLLGRSVGGVRRNYGDDELFFDSDEGRSRLKRSIDMLVGQDILRHEPKSIFETAHKSVPLARLLITLGYASEK
jgi:hypothetical protein